MSSLGPSQSGNTSAVHRKVVDESGLDPNMKPLEATSLQYFAVSPEYEWLEAARASNEGDVFAAGADGLTTDQRKSAEVYYAWMRLETALKAFFGENYEDRLDGLNKAFEGYGLDEIGDGEPPGPQTSSGGRAGGGGRRGNGKFYIIDDAAAAIASRNIKIGDRQITVQSALAEATQLTGLNLKFAYGLWGIESSWGQNLQSPTKCIGDWQFTKATFIGVLRQNRDKFPADLQDEIDQVLNGHVDLRANPRLSTFAAMFYVRTIADGLKLDPNKPENWGIIYSAYNAGPGNAQLLVRLRAAGSSESAMRLIGDAARYNAAFYQNGANGAQVLNNYQSRFMRYVGISEVTFPALQGKFPGPAIKPSTLQLAPEGLTSPVLPETKTPPVSTAKAEAPTETTVRAGPSDQRPSSTTGAASASVVGAVRTAMTAITAPPAGNAEGLTRSGAELTDLNLKASAASITAPAAAKDAALTSSPSGNTPQTAAATAKKDAVSVTAASNDHPASVRVTSAVAIPQTEVQLT